MQNLDVRMVHEDLASAPAFELPDSFLIEGYKPGRELDWLRIHEYADEYNSFTPFVFADQFKKHSDVLHEIQFYLLNPDGVPIGTATAWNDERTAYSGRVHWIAILPEYQNRGLGKALLSKICRVLQQNGHRKGSLSTSTARVAAIKLYLTFGFTPQIQSELDEMNWQVFEQESGVKALN